MRWVILFAVGACVPADDERPAATPAGDFALYRVESGESIGFVADKLQFPGGHRALIEALGKRSPELRAGEGLAIPIGYTRALGLDPYLDLGLAPYQPPLELAPLVPCHTVEDHGACVDLGDRRLCIEATPPRLIPGDPDEVVCDWQPDGAEDCPHLAGRELVLYRGDQRRVLSTLPTGDRWNHGVLDLESHRIDLDGDRADELIAIVPLGTWSRGGLSSSRLFVIDGRTEQLLQLDVDQWGPGSIVAADRPGRATCDLLITSWEEGELDPRRPAGWYLVGRPYDYDRGQLLPVGERRVKRQRERVFHLEEHGAPADWLSEPDVSRWLELPARGEVRAGRIAAIRAQPAVGLAIDIAFPDGTVETYDPRAEGRERLRVLGWAPTSSPLAAMYIPGDPARWLDAPVLVDVPPPPSDDGWELYDLGREIWIAPSI